MPLLSKTVSGDKAKRVWSFIIIRQSVINYNYNSQRNCALPRWKLRKWNRMWLPGAYPAANRHFWLVRLPSPDFWSQKVQKQHLVQSITRWIDQIMFVLCIKYNWYLPQIKPHSWSAHSPDWPFRLWRYKGPGEDIEFCLHCPGVFHQEDPWWPRRMCGQTRSQTQSTPGG